MFQILSLQTQSDDAERKDGTCVNQLDSVMKLVVVYCLSHASSCMCAWIVTIREV